MEGMRLILSKLMLVDVSFEETRFDKGINAEEDDLTKILSKLFGNGGGAVVDKLAKVADRFIRTNDEKAEFEKEMTQIFIEAEKEMQKNVTERRKTDLEHGNWLTRSVRPLVLVFLIVTTVLMVFIDSGSIAFQVEEKWTDLLQLVLITVIGAYFGVRSVEKIRKK